MAGTAAIIGVGVAAIGTGASIYEGQQAQGQAKKAASAQQAEQNQLEQQQQQQQATQNDTANAAQQLAGERASAGAASGYGSTILTSPLGIQGNSANTTGKTLLGS